MRTRVITTLAAVVTAGALVVLTAAPAQANGYPPPPQKSITETAIDASGGPGVAGTADGNPYDYDILVAALTATGLAANLADTSQRYTVFAPNDAAFIRTVSDIAGGPVTEQQAMDAVLALPDPTNILLGHVVAGRVLGPVSVLLAGRITMANGSVIRPRFLTLRDEDVDRPDPRLVLSAINIRCSNGVIHTIDRVLLPAGV